VSKAAGVEIGRGRREQLSLRFSCARAPVILHKQSVKILDRFVQIAYCNLCAPVLYYNCSEGEGKQRQGTSPEDAEKKFEKPLDKPPQVCYNKSVNKRGA